MRPRIFFELCNIDCLLLITDPGRFKRVAGQRHDLFLRQIEGIGQCVIIVTDVAAKVSRVIGMSRDFYAFGEQFKYFRSLHFRTHERVG